NPRKNTNTHGSSRSPEPRHRGMAGVCTTYENSSGWGNSWTPTVTMWPVLDKPTHFDPYTMAYFYLQYYFRERCWNLQLTDEQFAARLQRRLFDADAPADGGQRYAQLSRWVLAVYDGGAKPGAGDLRGLRKWLTDLGRKPLTPRTKDTLSRMEEALRHLGG